MGHSRFGIMIVCQLNTFICSSLFLDHELFKTLLNEHYGDFRNSNAPTVPPEQGPREPWRDIHSKVEGPIAHDVFQNFYDRWNKQGKKYGNFAPIDLTRYFAMQHPVISTLMINFYTLELMSTLPHLKP